MERGLSRVQAASSSACCAGRVAARVGVGRCDDGGADPWLAQVVPGCFDQQPACIAGAGLGDRALAAALARLVEAGHEPEPGGELRGSLEAAEVADLEAEYERG